MGKKLNGGLANLGAVRRPVDTAGANSNAVDPLRHKRQLVADLCRLLGNQAVQRDQPPPSPPPSAPAQQLPNLSPRMRQTLERLLLGDSEKQIAAHLGVSRHTVHVYVKALYKGFGVCSRGELLARFVRQPKL
jgi:DNA-binding CsgD family transcriptional regulator